MQVRTKGDRGLSMKLGVLASSEESRKVENVEGDKRNREVQVRATGCDQRT